MAERAPPPVRVVKDSQAPRGALLRDRAAPVAGNRIGGHYDAGVQPAPRA